MAIVFEPINNYQPGILFSLLKQSYQPLIDKDLKYWQPEVKKWQHFDQEAFNKIDTVGKCCLISTINQKPVGFISYDPRKKPKLIIGHNCILPKYQNKGHGKQQLKKLLQRLKKDFKIATVTTNSNPFFLPAQKMYLAVGFKEVRRYSGGPDPKYQVIEYRKLLKRV